MRQALLFGVLAGVLAFILMVLALGGHDGDTTTTAIAAGFSTIIGVLVTAGIAQQNKTKGDGGSDV